MSPPSYSFDVFFKLGVTYIWTGYDHLATLLGLLIKCDRERSVFQISLHRRRGHVLRYRGKSYTSAKCRTLCIFSLCLSKAFSQTVSDETTSLAPFVVQDRSTDLVGSATTSSQGAVGYTQLEDRPLLRRGELLEVIPGVVITQHSGDGKANQYFLRGFNLDHGTDFSISVDDMPVNMRTHAHGQGYSDLNFLIPELVQDITYNKGPYFAEVGDFSAAGAAQFHLFNELPYGLLSVTVGEDQYVRVVAADSIREKNTSTTFGFEVGYNNGPWDLSEDARHFSAVVRQNWGDAEQHFDLTAMVYHAEWRSTDQVPERAIDSGLIDRFGNIDPSDGGATDRDSLSFSYTANKGGGTVHAAAYAIYYRLNLFSDFTYYLDDPVHGDQFNQRDRHLVLGGDMDYSWANQIAGHKADSKVGLQIRQDFIPQVALFHTEDRVYVSTISDNDVKEGSIGLFGENEIHWSNWLRSNEGLRFDAYRFDVSNEIAANSGNKTAAIVSPKLGLVIGPWQKTEYYFNAGLGFHSNDARGVMLHEDPQSGDPIDPASPLVRSKGVELGARTSAIPGVVSSVSLWALELNSELVFSGDSGGTEASGATRRYGVEFANFYRVNSWLILDADLSLTHARYKDAVEGGGRYVANSIGTVLTAGSMIELRSGFFTSVRLRYFGPQPIIEDDSEEEPASTTVNARIGYRRKKWEISVDVLNVFNKDDADIAYYYASRLPGEPADGVNDVHVHPAEPRQIRMTLTRRF